MTHDLPPTAAPEPACASQPAADPPCRGGPVPDAAVAAEAVPAWLAGFDASAAALVDVRPMLAEGREPIADVLAAAEQIPSGGGLIILAPFNPAPLRGLLHQRGFATYGRRLGERRWNIRVVRGAAAPSPVREARPVEVRRTGGGGLKLGGATQRLLPEVIPLRFFGVALLCHAAAWAGILIFAEEVSGYRGGAGPVLAVLHLVALGVLLATAMGASFQMLPVAFALPPPPARLCHLAFVLLVTGGAGLISGFALYEPLPMVGGAILLGGAVMLHGLSMTRLVMQAGDDGLLRWHLGAALVAIGCAVVLAIGLSLDVRFGWLDSHPDVARAHLVLAGFGFMGLLVLGFSQILMPMFAVSNPTGDRLAWAAFALAVLAVLGAEAGALADLRALLIAGLVAGLCAALCHIIQMTLMLRKRIRARLGPEFLLIRLSWLFCPLSLGLALAIVLEAGPDTLTPLFGFCLIFGWYLSFLLGVLQRILPFLASMHASRLGAKALSPVKLASEPCLTVHRWCHIAALALVGAGLILADGWIIRLGALAGLAGALAFLLFGAEVLKRTRGHISAASA